jgi:hypothetical protein
MVTDKQLALEGITCMLKQYGIKFTINYFVDYGYLFGIDVIIEGNNVILQDKYNKRNKITLKYHQIKEIKE